MPGRSGAATPLGREVEQADLYDALSLALKGEPQVVVIAGDAGLGRAHPGHRPGPSRRGAGRQRRDRPLSRHRGWDLVGPAVEALTTLVAGIEDVDSRPLARRIAHSSTPRGRAPRSSATSSTSFA